jgi:hypothetical protein
LRDRMLSAARFRATSTLDTSPRHLHSRLRTSWVIGVSMEWRRLVQCDRCGESSFVHGVHFEYTKGEANYQIKRVVVSTKCPNCGVRNVPVRLPIPKPSIDQTIRCDSQQDAQQMSLSGNLAYDALERKQSGAEVAKQLEDAVRLFLKYGCTDRAAWLHEHAKYAKGEPSIFDTVRDAGD